MIKRHLNVKAGGMNRSELSIYVLGRISIWKLTARHAQRRAMLPRTQGVRPLTICCCGLSVSPLGFMKTVVTAGNKDAFAREGFLVFGSGMTSVVFPDGALSPAGERVPSRCRIETWNSSPPQVQQLYPWQTGVPATDVEKLPLDL